jgi:hypothetical protein
MDSKRCLTPILPLTDEVDVLRAAINGMQFKNSSHEPKTYIPAGLLWGINVVSPTVPFQEGAEYDTANREPRKAIVLMTDGENTLKYTSSNGRHDNATPAQIVQSNNDTISLCTYAKSKKIEIFTVAFGQINASALTMLQNCATSTEHYFAATSSADLNDAFENIADKLRVVRIVQ